MRKNRKGFTIVEFVVGLAVVGMLVVAVYLYQNPKTQTDQTPDGTNTEKTVVDQTNDSRKVYPTIEPVTADSDDAELNAAANSLNALSEEINELDKLDEELELPEVDLSVE